jgi:hypothetical protein
MSNLTNTAVTRLGTILKKHESDRIAMVDLLKKSHNSYVALRLEHGKLSSEHKATVAELERAKAEIKRLDKENAERGTEIMMLTETISLFDESFAQSDNILLDSIRHMARDLRVEEPALPQISLTAISAVQAPSLVPSLVDDADDAELEASTAATDGEASGSVFVADVAAPGAASSDFLSDADEAKLEEFLIEKVEFAIEA